MFKFINCINYSVFDGWVDHWCIDFTLVWWIPNRSAIALLQNTIRKNRLLHH
jgi:hypothetical protein